MCRALPPPRDRGRAPRRRHAAAERQRNGAPEAANASNITTDAWGSTGQRVILGIRKPDEKVPKKGRKSRPAAVPGRRTAGPGTNQAYRGRRARDPSTDAEDRCRNSGRELFLVDTCGAKATFRVPVGAVAQLGERCVRNAEVRGSIPLRSTLQALEILRDALRNEAALRLRLRT